MACFHPITAYKVEYQNELVFGKEPKAWVDRLKIPCGKCIGCLLDSANDQSTRCWCEAKQWENNCFITLTYNDENLPEGAYLCKKDVQDFFKRLRYYEQGLESWEVPGTNKTEYPIRYYLCGEYGPKTLRPHYHACIFNWKPKDLKFYKENHCGDRLFTSKTLSKIWGKGFVIVGDLNYQSACYVARYVQKKIFKGVQKNNAQKLAIQPEFTLSSRNGGIGIGYWNKNRENIIKNHGILVKIKDKVKNKKIPKYFMRKWKESVKTWEEISQYDEYMYEKQKNGQKMWEEQLSKTTLTESEYMAMLERNLTEKAKTLSRNNQV